MHDVLHLDGVSRVFAEHVVASPEYAEVGIVGSIGWGRLRRADESVRLTAGRRRMASSLLRHARWTGSGNRGMRRLVGKALRTAVPHSEIAVSDFQRFIG